MTLQKIESTYSASVNELLWFAQTMLQAHGKPKRCMLWPEWSTPRPSRLWNEVGILDYNSTVEDLENESKQYTEGTAQGTR